MAVTRFGFSAKKLAPDFKRLSPLARLRELPRQNFPALMQAMVLLPLFGAAVYFICRDRFAEYLRSAARRRGNGSARRWAASLDRAAVERRGRLHGVRRRSIWSGSGAGIAQDLRMSQQEIRDEFKETEGNPQMKMRIRRLLRDRSAAT